MDKLQLFKDFVKNNPILLKYIKSGEMTWQKFYEMYDLYGDSSEVWNDYIEDKKVTKESKTTNDFMTFLKGIDLDSIQEGVQSIQRVLGVIGDISNNNKETNNAYKPRPLYKHFDD